MNRLIDQAIEQHPPVVAVFGLFSGGHDSLTSTSIAAQHPRFTAAVHINTGIGIEETREFVRETCKEQGWPLIEMHPQGRSYEELVLTRGGFPSGPRSHNSMYWHLKQRSLRRLIQDTKTARNDRVVLVTGIRTSESVRRMGSGISVPIRRNRAEVWVNPILDWSAADCLDHMAAHGLRRSPVVDLLHRSGECLCGALARSEEITEIDTWFPVAAKRIHALEATVAGAGIKHSQWASGKAWGTSQPLRLPMCVSCEVAEE